MTMSDTFFHQLRGHKAERIMPPGAGFAAVMIPLLQMENGAVYVLFEERARGIRQGGEICFPGGMMEGSETPEITVLREVEEELLVSPDSIELIAPMHCMSGPGGTEVTSVLGWICDYRGTCSKAEVARTFTVPLEWFLEHEPKVYQAQMITQPEDGFPYGKISADGTYRFRPIRKEFVFYDVPGEVIHAWETGDADNVTIWGMTAMLLHRFVNMLQGRSL